MDKRTLIKSLLKGEKLNKESYLFIIEHHKVSETIGFFKIEVMDSKEEILFKFKIQMDLTTPNNQKEFSPLKIGDKKFNVGFLQLAGKTFFSKVKEGIESAVGEGRIPFFPGS